MRKYIIGLSVTYHDPALVIVDGQGQVLFAEATERFLQNKRALNCEPDQLALVARLLTQYCPDPDEITIAINWQKRRPWYETVVNQLGCLSAPGLLKQGIKRLRSLLENYKLHHMVACQRQAINLAGINLVRTLQQHYPACRLSFVDFDHHLTHAATACFTSPYQQAACAVIDSFGEKGSMAFYRYEHGQLKRIYESRGTGSIGFYYMKITELCGFDWLKGEEWKVMGLAPYGQLNEEFYGLLKSTITLEGFHCSHRGAELFKGVDRLQDFKRGINEPIESAADLAFTGQFFFQELMTGLLEHLHQVTGLENLTLAGGCGLNSAFNGYITQKTGFKSVHIPSAPADDGTALGAALLSFRQQNPVAMRAPVESPYLGSVITDQAVEHFKQFNQAFTIEHLPGRIVAETAKRLSGGALIAWVQGRAEFGPRALGNRSILADPRFAKTQDVINQRIKFREKYRPFAPAILAQYGPDYFEHYQDSPYMDKTLTIRPDKRSQLGAVCHVDGTGRLQSVTEQRNARFYALLTAFYDLTDVPVLLNTSFNVMGKPLVHSLEDCLTVFMTTGLDALVVNDYLITKKADER